VPVRPLPAGARADTVSHGEPPLPLVLVDVNGSVSPCVERGSRCKVQTVARVTTHISDPKARTRKEIGFIREIERDKRKRGALTGGAPPRSACAHRWTTLISVCPVCAPGCARRRGPRCVAETVICVCLCVYGFFLFVNSNSVIFGCFTCFAPLFYDAVTQTRTKLRANQGTHVGHLHNRLLPSPGGLSAPSVTLVCGREGMARRRGVING
jgi:hypothetical protein